MSREKIVIIGAAGRDFHNFNCVFRDDDKYEVVAFTAARSPTSTDAATPPRWRGASIRRASPSTPRMSCRT